MKYMFIVGVVSANSRQLVNMPVYRYSFMFLNFVVIFYFTSFILIYFIYWIFWIFRQGVGL